LCDPSGFGSTRTPNPGSHRSAPGAIFCDHFVVEIRRSGWSTGAGNREEQADSKLNPTRRVQGNAANALACNRVPAR